MTTEKVPKRMAAAIVIGLAVFLLAAVHSAEACSCSSPPPPCAAVQSGDLIFVGTPTSAAPGEDDNGLPLMRFRFVVEEPIAGNPGAVIDIETPTNEAACGFSVSNWNEVSCLCREQHHEEGRPPSARRTGPVAFRQDDLALLRETAAGRARPRLSGVVTRFELFLDGFFMHGGPVAGVPRVPITIRGDRRQQDVETDDQGRFRLVGLEPGIYEIEPRLPRPYEPLFDRLDRPVSVKLDGCLAEAYIVVASVPLSGEARNVDGSVANERVMLRVAQLDAANSVSFERTTLAFVGRNGRWKLPGLPPGRYVIGVSTFDAPSSGTPYPTMWFPAALRASDATVLRGERRPAADDRLPSARGSHSRKNQRTSR